MIKVYLDNCSFNRPYDDQENIKIRLETEAKLHIQKLILTKKINLIWSYILDYENSKNPFIEKKLRIYKWKKFAIRDIEENNEILNLAKSLEIFSLKKMDLLHVACAIYGECDYFITTDIGILKKSENIKNIKITDPITFIREFCNVE